MIRLVRPHLHPRLDERLRDRTRRLREQQATATAARTSWSGARTIKAGLKDQLSRMAAGIGRCMYCGDNFGTDIDHFEPVAQAPLRAFDWPNHLLACSHCNSNHKRDSFPRAADGSPLLIDPTAEDPYDHLGLALSTGTYEGLTSRGHATIAVFALNRPDLERGRASAYLRSKSMIRDHLSLVNDGRPDEAAEVVAALREHPFPDVLYAMLRYSELPGARSVFGADLLTALAHPALRLWP